MTALSVPIEAQSISVRSSQLFLWSSEGLEHRRLCATHCSIGLGSCETQIRATANLQQLSITDHADDKLSLTLDTNSLDIANTPGEPNLSRDIADRQI